MLQVQELSGIPSHSTQFLGLVSNGGESSLKIQCKAFYKGCLCKFQVGMVLRKAGPVGLTSPRDPHAGPRGLVQTYEQHWMPRNRPLDLNISQTPPTTPVSLPPLSSDLEKWPKIARTIFHLLLTKDTRCLCLEMVTESWAGYLEASCYDTGRVTKQIKNGCQER